MEKSTCDQLTLHKTNPSDSIGDGKTLTKGSEANQLRTPDRSKTVLELSVESPIIGTIHYNKSTIILLYKNGGLITLKYQERTKLEADIT